MAVERAITLEGKSNSQVLERARQEFLVRKNHLMEMVEDRDERIRVCTEQLEDFARVQAQLEKVRLAAAQG